MIAEERENIRETANYYRQRKDLMKSSLTKNDLERLLAKSESAIKEFLDGEDQLKRYLEFFMEKSEGVAK
jgi:arsenate reductase-like glutaredoxin family protein